MKEVANKEIVVIQVRLKKSEYILKKENTELGDYWNTEIKELRLSPGFWSEQLGEWWHHSPRQRNREIGRAHV